MRIRVWANSRFDKEGITAVFQWSRVFSPLLRSRLIWVLRPRLSCTLFVPLSSLVDVSLVEVASLFKFLRVPDLAFWKFRCNTIRQTSFDGRTWCLRVAHRRRSRRGQRWFAQTTRHAFRPGDLVRVVADLEVRAAKVKPHAEVAGLEGEHPLEHERGLIRLAALEGCQTEQVVVFEIARLIELERLEQIVSFRGAVGPQQVLGLRHVRRCRRGVLDHQCERQGEPLDRITDVTNRRKARWRPASYVAVGDGNKDDAGKRIALDVAKGDTVLYSKYGGTEIKVDGEDLLVLRESDVLAKVGK